MNEAFEFRQRRADAGDIDVLGQEYRQLVVGHRHRAAVLTINHRDRAAPIALARDAPVAQAEVSLLLAQSQGRQIGGDGIDGVVIGQAIVGTGIDANAVFRKNILPARPNQTDFRVIGLKNWPFVIWPKSDIGAKALYCVYGFSLPR